MKRLFLLIAFHSIIIAFVISCSTANRYSEYEDETGNFIETGVASWYGPNFQGKLTANGEVYDMYDFTAAHKTLPFNSIVKVINKSTGQWVIVRINDRGPFVKNRIIDLSKIAAEEIDMIESGYTNVDLVLLRNADSSNKKYLDVYTIQIGSFKNEREARKFSSKFDNTKVVRTIINGETYFRVYSGNYSSKNEAEKEKMKLVNKGIEAFVKKLE